MTTLNDTDIATCMSRYMEYMREIKIRAEVIRKTTDAYNLSLKLEKKVFVTGYIETDIDLIYLQLRKIIELIMYSCVVANELAGIELTKKLRKSYQPKEIRKILQNHNNDFSQPLLTILKTAKVQSRLQSR